MKNIILIIFLSLMLNANVNTKIKNIIGYKAYNKHINLINHIFKNKENYYTQDGLVDYIKISQKLKENNLLKLKFSSLKYIDITFKIKGKVKKTIFMLKNVLKSLGYYYFITTKASKINNKFIWSIKVKSKVAIDPLRLSKALYLRNIKLLDISKEGYSQWHYAIDSTVSNIYKVEDLEINEQLVLKKTQKPYFIKIAGASIVKFYPNSFNRWHPNIVFYDEDMNILEIYKEDSLQTSLELEVPIDTKYIKIDDIYTLDNLKRGMVIDKE